MAKKNKNDFSYKAISYILVHEEVLFSIVSQLIGQEAGFLL